MKTKSKKIVVAACGGILLASLFCQTAGAQSVIVGTPGSSVLADAFTIDTGPEALPVTWDVTQSGAIYTYTYQVMNRAGDVVLNNNGTPTTTSEVVDAFSVAFDTTAPGAFIAGSQMSSQMVGSTYQNNGTAGLFWSFDAVAAGTCGPVLQFESYLPPTLGNANAQDANPPSPWSSSPFGQQVPIPNDAVPEPASTALFALGGFLLLPFRAAFRNRK